MFDDLMKNMGLNQHFAQAQNNHDAVDPQAAADYVSQFMRSAPPEVQQQVLSQYVSQLDPQQRQALAQAMVQHQGTPVENVRADDDHDMTQALERSGQTLSQQGGAGGIGSLFGMMGGGQQSGGQSSGGLGGMLGGLLGGGNAQQNNPQYGNPQHNPQAQGQNPMGGLGQVLQNPMARAGLVSLAAVIGSQLLGANRR